MKSSNETVVDSSSDRVLVIMAKAPRPGRVKTRLTPSLSPETVTAFYRCLLDDTLALARSLDHVEVAVMCPDSDVNELAGLAGKEVRVVAQKGKVLLQASLQYLPTSPKKIDDALSPSTATAHTCPVLFSKTRSKG
ncbi:MAG TPA: hypothetical protein VE218_09060 [Acidobacteriaceae bacterium]|nr:hypothetical protein [Acidobacteriaceae bacterium]